ncbi:MAG: hypothetical protein FJW35_02330 [Acidobacteria bacterium]|nr:hypothetical protein [Acidobacteriota bacterium]
MCERVPIANLDSFCREALESAFPAFRGHEIYARFYPYIGLTHTIRRRGKGWAIRISDHCADAAPDVLQAIVVILGGKVLRRQPPGELAERYRRFRRNPRIQERIEARRAERGTKRMAGAEGRTHSLRAIFDQLNRRYFNAQVEVRGLGWGLRPAWTRLGHYDPVHDTITVSPVLDSRAVPPYVVSYIVYHEMLHALFDGRAAPGRRHLHFGSFRKAERAHPDHERARRFLRRFLGRRGRRAAIQTVECMRAASPAGAK